MMKRQGGFSIVELMIVVAIIGVIASIAIPIYTKYVTRAKIAETLTLLGGLKTPMVEYYDNWSVWTSVAVIGGKTSGRYTSIITSGEVENEDKFYVEATMKGPGDLAQKRLRMTYEPSSLDWECTVNGVTDPIDNKFLPSYCRSN